MAKIISVLYRESYVVLNNNNNNKVYAKRNFIMERIKKVAGQRSEIGLRDFYTENIHTHPQKKFIS